MLSGTEHFVKIVSFSLSEKLLFKKFPISLQQNFLVMVEVVETIAELVFAELEALRTTSTTSSSNDGK